MFSEINQYINSCVHLSEEELKIFDSFFVEKKIPKKRFLLQAGDICNIEAFVVKGCLKTYYIDGNGFEVILTFAIEGWWVSDIASFCEQKPSKMFIETIEDCVLLVLSPQAKEEMLQKLPCLERVYRLLVQRHLSVYQERLFGNIALTAQERYALFLEKYPTISQRIPQHLIASYLGISAEFLSRIRKRKKNT